MNWKCVVFAFFSSPNMEWMFHSPLCVHTMVVLPNETHHHKICNIFFRVLFSLWTSSISRFVRVKCQRKSNTIEKFIRKKMKRTNRFKQNHSFVSRRSIDPKRLRLSDSCVRRRNKNDKRIHIFVPHFTFGCIRFALLHKMGKLNICGVLFSLQKVSIAVGVTGLKTWVEKLHLLHCTI